MRLHPVVLAFAIAMLLGGGLPHPAAAYERWSTALDAPRDRARLARITGEALPDPENVQVLPTNEDPVERLLHGGMSPSSQGDGGFATNAAGISWEAVPPPARWVHSMIYDPIRDRLVIFGGQGYSGSTSELWAFYLSGIPHWQKLSPSGPVLSGRAFHSAIFDSLRDRMIVFGGEDGSGASKNDVWSLSFAGNPTWSQIIPTGTPPPPRRWHVAVYDRVRDRMLVMGGANGMTAMGDVWALSLAGTPAWSQLAPSGGGPGARQAHTGVYDAAGDRVVIFGGLDGAAQPRNDVWALSLAGTPTWSALAPTGTPPTPRYGSSAMYDGIRRRLVLFAGGVGAPNTNQAFTLSLSGAPAWTALAPTNPPQGRQFHTAAYDPIGDRMLAYGGSSGAILSDVWALPLASPTAWMPLSGTRRKGHSALFDSARERMVVFGGESASTLNDVWELTLDQNPLWSRLWPGGTLPTPRALHTAIYEPKRDRMLVFGGRNTTPTNDVWELTFSGELAWHLIVPTGTPPSARLDHSAVYDPFGNRMLVFGGADAGGVYNDVWAMSLVGAPTWTPIVTGGTAPSGRGGAHAIFDNARNRLVVYGGYDRNFNALGDVFALSLGGTPTWTKLLPSGTAPEPRFAGAAIYDAARDRMLVSSGTDFTVFFPETWSLQFGAGASAWQLLAFTGPTPASRSDHKAIYDQLADRLIFFGGQNTGGILHDTWSLDFANTVAVPPLPVVPSRVALLPAQPNPSRLGTTLGFALPRAVAHADLALYDLAGRRVRLLAAGPFDAGTHPVRWDGNDDAGRRAPAGVYFARLSTVDGVATGKIVVAQ